ncbi:hypothetical protein MHYP_G00315870 [Metynnis hypsauchen]
MPNMEGGGRWSQLRHGHPGRLPPEVAPSAQRGQDSGCIPPQQLDVYAGKNCLEFQQAPKYLGVRLDRTLSYKQHLDEVKAKVDTTINSTLWIVTGCLKATPASYLPVLAGITPASLRRDAAILTLARKAQKYDWHILHKATITSAPPGRLKSRHPYSKAVQEMLQSILEDLSRDAWLAATWKQTWEMAGPSCIQQYIRDGRFKSSLKKWGLSDSAACECGEPEQTAEHIITGCPLYSPPSEAGLFDLGPETRAWLHGTEFAI